MHFLIDANMPRRCYNVLRQAGHEFTDVRDIGMGDAADTEIAAYAVRHRLCILTRDFHLADIRRFPPKEHAGIIVLSLPKEDTTTGMICDILNKFLSDMPPQMQGHLVIADKNRFRVTY
jgi:predicted nuclease of predicted toxin-antitoxin system